MAAGSGSANVAEAVIPLLPADTASGAEFDRLKAFTRDLDRLVKTGPHGTHLVDKTHLFTFIDQSGVFPEHLRARVKEQLAHHLPERLKEGGGEPLAWHRLHEHGASFAPNGVRRLKEIGFESEMETDRARELLDEHFPYLPAEILDADGAQLREFAVRALEHNRTVWDCCVAHLGWWGALGVFALAGALLIVGTATGPWGTALAIWLIGVLGGGTAVIVMNCLLNPNR